MAANLVFDPSQFENLIDKYGIKKAWRNILATHIVMVTNLCLLVCCKYIPTSIEPTTPPTMNTAPK